MKLKNQIEGEWGQFVFKMVEPADIPAILEHLKENFHRDETITSLCPPDDKFADFANARIAKLLEKNLPLNFVVLDKRTGEIAGCQSVFKWTKEEAESGSTPHFGLPGEEIPPTRAIINKVVAPLHKHKIDLFYKFGVDFLAWNFISSTGRKFRGMGLASEMYKRMVILLKQENFSLVYSVFTSPFTRRCAEKVGFIETARLYFASVLDENGQQVLPNCNKDDFGSIMALQI